MENKQKMIEVQDLCKSFHKLEVLKNILGVSFIRR